MEELSYSFHIGSDKNKKNSVRLTSKNNVSGTNSMSNNAKIGRASCRERV